MSPRAGAGGLATTIPRGAARAADGGVKFLALGDWGRDALDLEFRDFTGAAIYRATLARERTALAA